MSVRVCRDGDLQYCKKIWKICFDDGDFADFYFSFVHRNEDAFVFEYNNNVTGYLASIPFTADVNERPVSCRYIYGVSVLPEFRNRGFMRRMLDSALKIDCGFNLLIPAVENLYEKFGFSSFTDRKEVVINNSYGSLRECDNIQFLNSIYDCFRRKYDISLRRSEHWWDLIIQSAKNEGFKIFANEGAYAFVKGDYVSEFAYISEKYRDSLPIGDCMLHLPPSLATGGLCNENNYLALMLD